MATPGCTQMLVSLPYHRIFECGFFYVIVYENSPPGGIKNSILTSGAYLYPFLLKPAQI